MAPKLTKEEQKALKEAIKLEKARVLAEAKKQERRNELSREMAMQAIRRGEIDKSWREIMLRIKQPVLKHKVEVLWHSFERVYDKKDNLIHHMMKLIELAEDQYQRTICGFCDIIDTNILKFYNDLENLSKDNDLKTAALLKWGAQLRSRLMDEATDAENHLQILVYHGFKTFDDYTWEKRGETIVKEDEEKTTFLDIRDNLKSNLENIYNNMWTEYKTVLKTYVHDTADNQKNARKLRKKENVIADIIDTQAKKLASSEETLNKLKKELASYESGTKQEKYRSRRDRHRRAASRLKQRLHNGIAIDQKRLATLVHAANESIEFLEALHKKGEKILRLAGLCRRFETQREKVLPFESKVPLESKTSKALVRNTSEHSLVTNTMMTSFGLGRLWDRISRADLSKRALIREKVLLESENDYLMEQLEELNTKATAKIKSADEFRCTCGKKTKNIMKPSSVDGGLEMAKYRKYY